MTQTIIFHITITTPHTDEPLNETEQARNCIEARIAITAALQRAGFAIVAIEEEQS